MAHSRSSTKANAVSVIKVTSITGHRHYHCSLITYNSFFAIKREEYSLHWVSLLVQLRCKLYLIWKNIKGWRWSFRTLGLVRSEA